MACAHCHRRRSLGGPLDNLVDTGQKVIDNAQNSVERQTTTGILTVVAIGLGITALLFLLRDSRSTSRR